MLVIGINMLEQYNLLTRLIIIRVVDGIAANLLLTVFESLLVTEHRKEDLISANCIPQVQRSFNSPIILCCFPENRNKTNNNDETSSSFQAMNFRLSKC